MTNRIISLLGTYKGLKNTPVFSYTIFKYLEFAVNALLFFLLARMATPLQYGEASAAFIIISYSSFIVLGINQVVVKWYSISNDLAIKDFLVKYSASYNFIFSLIVFLIVYNVDFSPYFLYSAIIAACKINIEGFITGYRVQSKFYKINLVYICSSLFFFLFFIVFVKSVEDFFFFWSVTSVLTMIMSAVLALSDIIRRVEYSFFMMLKIHNSEMFLDGLKFTLISILTTLMASSDRFYLIYIIKLDKNLLGNIQLADNIANVITLGFSTILFVITPQLIKQVNNGSLKPSVFYNKSTKAFVILCGLLVCLFFPLRYAITALFPNYDAIAFPLAIYLFIKLFSLFLSVPYIIAIALSAEKKYLTIQLIWGILLFLTMAFSYNFFISNSYTFYLVPILVLLINIGLFVHFRFKFVNKEVVN